MEAVHAADVMRFEAAKFVADTWNPAYLNRLQERAARK